MDVILTVAAVMGLCIGVTAAIFWLVNTLARSGARGNGHSSLD